ncbi:prepilin-type N-terminal cleavage/methylation domain-containing protein [Pelagicoccus sp. NFK12]|uniref:Prepilin-type N-terminal cleavage/methylation domain-containing protein n=1 Tax=Pelagicoccus enzymogenes TaxID=2773457 RepID=A0A927IJQ7_9BACT|nr:prepilin-type N-terminal cleavage/methylation domain-containing protein [Pelagicoccus enzymogenes]MBD5781800.1 prepilin-type N-terminal cleavage/methylation domain-containing protein [Pelagicoccus enzymogenes]MDQ8196556.1 prepilin-type N-terminal cleavage/methylation domain-containing protein [Pelagicoccus enzymogenes]
MKPSHPNRIGRKKPSKQSGFTLVEAMVAMVIASVALVGVFGGLGRSFELIEESRDSTRVAQIIQSELEDLRTLSWSEVAALPENSGWFTPSSSFASEFGTRYSCYRQIFARGTGDQFVMRVWVKWTNSDGHTKLDNFMTLYTKGGFNDYYYRSF